MKKYLTIIIGAGPAGLNCAIKCASPQNDVIIIEKNEKAGKKLFITGKGRCNVTNACSNNDFINNVVRNPKFLYSAINNFSTQDTIVFFNSHKCPLVIERGNRVFPASYHAYDITDTLVKECKTKGVSFNFNEEVINIKKETDKFRVLTSRDTYICDFVVIATGGITYPSTGSTGDGYKFASNFNHEIINQVPGLSSLKIKEEIDDKLNMFTLKNVALTAIYNKKKIREFGELTLSKFILEGPIAKTLSSQINRIDKDQISIEIDFKPALEEEKLMQRLIRDISSNPNEKVSFLLKGLLPFELINFFTKYTSTNIEKKCSDFSKIERIKLINDLKHFVVTYEGLDDINKAVVTSGGVSISGINSSTMESKLVNNLFFAGEVIDVDAFTGGFNIQIALSTGALAAKSILDKIK